MVDFAALHSQQLQPVLTAPAIETPALPFTANTLYLVAVTQIRGSSTDPIIPTMAGWQQFWQQIGDTIWTPTATNRRRTTLFYCLAGQSGSGPLTASWGTQTPSMAAMHVISATGAAGIAAVTESAFNLVSGVNTPLALPPATDPNNRVCAFAAMNVNTVATLRAATIADGASANWITADVEGSSSAPTNATIGVYLDAAFNTSPAIWQTTASSGFAYMGAVEVQAATTPTFPGCPIGPDGWRVVIEAFYNPDGIRRFGSLRFGDQVFGDSSGAGAPYWVDITASCFNARVQRGTQRPVVPYPADTFSFDVLDPDGTLFAWKPPASLSSPQIGTPVRLSWINPATPDVLSTTLAARIQRIQEIHATPVRTLQILAIGTHAELVTSILFPDRPSENAQQRIQWALNEIGWSYPVVYPDDLDTFGLEQDIDDRVGRDALASTIIEEAANSAGYTTYSGNDGTLLFSPLKIRTPSPPLATISDCDFPVGVDAVANDIEYTADTLAVLNVVQLVNKQFPNRSAEAIDATSVELYGRNANGYGFPLIVVNDSSFDAQGVADQMLSQTAFIVNRASSFTFNTLTDPRWAFVLSQLFIGAPIEIFQQKPQIERWNAYIIGYDMAIGTDEVSGTTYISTVDESRVRTI